MSPQGDRYGDPTADRALAERAWLPASRSLRAALHGLTTQGRSVLAAGLVVAAFSPLLGEKGLFRIAALLVALPLLAVLAVSATRTSVWCRRSVGPARICAQQPAQVRLRLTARRRSVQLRLEDAVPAGLATTDVTTSTSHPAAAADDLEVVGPRFRLSGLAAGSTAELEYRVFPRRRGHYVLGPLTVQCSDPFGMCMLSQPVSPAQTLIVTPPVTSLPLNPLIDGRAGLGEHRGQTLGAYGDDAASVRGWRHGDDPRRVHWRSTARAGELMVRQQEQPRHARATVMLDTRAVAYRTDEPRIDKHRSDAHNADPSEDGFEWAVAATASIAAHLIGQGLRVRLLTDTGQQVTSGESEVYDVLAVDKGRQIMDFLAGVTQSERGELRGGFAVSGDAIAPGWDGDPGVIIAIVGELSVDDAAWLGRSRGVLGGRAELRVALVVDGPSWEQSNIDDWLPDMARPGMTTPDVTQPEMEPHSSRTGSAGPVIPGWRSVRVARGSDVAALWRSLASQQQEQETPEVPSAGRDGATGGGRYA